jgi:hypothetical protein
MRFTLIFWGIWTIIEEEGEGGTMRTRKTQYCEGREIKQ